MFTSFQKTEEKSDVQQLGDLLDITAVYWLGMAREGFPSVRDEN
jgi:hypothetical protein